MQALDDWDTMLEKAGIIDLGGTGHLFLEIEYNNEKSEFKEAFFRLPDECHEHDIVSAQLTHIADHGVLSIEFSQIGAFDIKLPDRCSKLIAVRLPEAIGGEDITSEFGVS